MSQQPMVTPVGGSNNWFSTVTEGIAEGLGSVARDILPRWAAQELDLQSYDQLANSTFEAGNNGNGTVQKTGGITDEMNILRFGDLQIPETTLMFLLLGAVGMMVLFAARK